MQTIIIVFTWIHRCLCISSCVEASRGCWRAEYSAPGGDQPRLEPTFPLPSQTRRDRQPFHYARHIPWSTDRKRRHRRQGGDRSWDRGDGHAALGEMMEPPGIEVAKWHRIKPPFSWASALWQIDTCLDKRIVSDPFVCGAYKKQEKEQCLRVEVIVMKPYIPSEYLSGICLTIKHHHTICIYQDLV